MAVNKYGPQVHKALKENPLTPVYHSACIQCGREYYHIFEFQDNCYPCLMGTNPLHAIHARTKKHTKCASFKDFMKKYGDQPTWRHRFLQDPKTKEYAWRLAPINPKNTYTGVSPIGDGKRFMAYYRNKYIGSYDSRDAALAARETYVSGMKNRYVHEVDLIGGKTLPQVIPPAESQEDITHHVPKQVFRQETLSPAIEADIDEAFGDL